VIELQVTPRTGMRPRADETPRPDQKKLGLALWETVKPVVKF